MAFTEVWEALVAMGWALMEWVVIILTDGEDTEICMAEWDMAVCTAVILELMEDMAIQCTAVTTIGINSNLVDLDPW